jgi:hypothetical protein
MHHRDAARRIKTEALWAGCGLITGRRVIDSNRRSTDHCSLTSCNDERFAAGGMGPAPPAAPANYNPNQLSGLY